MITTSYWSLGVCAFFIFTGRRSHKNVFIREEWVCFVRQLTINNRAEESIVQGQRSEIELSSQDSNPFMREVEVSQVSARLTGGTGSQSSFYAQLSGESHFIFSPLFMIRLLESVRGRSDRFTPFTGPIVQSNSVVLVGQRCQTRQCPFYSGDIQVIRLNLPRGVDRRVVHVAHAPVARNGIKPTIRIQLHSTCDGRTAMHFAAITTITIESRGSRKKIARSLHVSSLKQSGGCMLSVAVEIDGDMIWKPHREETINEGLM